MFGLSSLELRLAFYGVLLAAISGWLIYEHHHLIAEGEDRIKAQDASARTAQKAEDAKVSAGVVNDLNEKLALALQSVPVPSLRLCQPSRRVRTGPATPGTQPPVASGTGEGSLGVPAGDLGLDIGPQLQASKRAADVLAIYADETRSWAVAQGAPLPR